MKTGAVWWLQLLFALARVWAIMTSFVVFQTHPGNVLEYSPWNGLRQFHFTMITPIPSCKTNADGTVFIKFKRPEDSVLGTTSGISYLQNMNSHQRLTAACSGSEERQPASTTFKSRWGPDFINWAFCGPLVLSRQTGCRGSRSVKHISHFHLMSEAQLCPYAKHATSGCNAKGPAQC